MLIIELVFEQFVVEVCGAYFPLSYPVFLHSISNSWIFLRIFSVLFWGDFSMNFKINIWQPNSIFPKPWSNDSLSKNLCFFRVLVCGSIILDKDRSIGWQNIQVLVYGYLFFLIKKKSISCQNIVPHMHIHVCVRISYFLFLFFSSLEGLRKNQRLKEISLISPVN